MATAKIRPSSRRKSVTLPRKRRLGQAMRVFRVLTLLAIPNLVLTCGGTTTTSSTTSRTTITPILEEDEETNCRVDFLLFPSSAPSSSSSSTRLLSSTSSSQPVHHHLDILQVTYRSSLTSPTLSLWCGDPDHHPRKASLKFRTSHVIPRTGNLEIPLNFSSDLPCWFELTQDDIYHCGDVNTSDTFLVLPTNHQGSATPPNRPATALAVRQEVGATTSATSSVVPTATADVHRGGGEHNLSPGAKVAVGISATVVFLSIVAMSALLFLRRRRKGHDTELAGAIIEHDRRSGKKGQEKKRNAAPSIASGGSEEPLYPPIIQPVFDGFPGSTGYDDVRSLHSSLINSHSPVHGPDSPTSLSNGPGFWGTQGRSIEREELAAARLKAKAHTTLPTVVSYGPNPVTPTLTPRTSSRVDLNKSVASHSPDSIEAIPHVPHIPVSIPDYIPDYSSYSIPPPTSTPSPPRKPAAPIVVSYGPNRVTPTPLVVSPTVPPDDSVINRRFQETVAGGGDINSNNNNNISNHNNSPYHHERQFSWEADSPLLGTTNMGPLPPYASTADFEAMEKGAVRKLAEPQAEAELPPTKDGFYHGYGAPDIVEYELPGAAPQNEPQLPHQNYKPHHYLAGSSSVAGGNVGGYREIEEQKFLLNDLMSDADIRRLKEEKAKQKAERERGMREARERGEEYDLGETMGEARAREREANGFGMGMGMGGGMNIR